MKANATVFYTVVDGPVRAKVCNPTVYGWKTYSLPIGAEIVFLVWTTDTVKAWHTYRSVKGIQE